MSVAKTILLIIAVSNAFCASDPGEALNVTRAVATLNGVFSPRGFFNILVRLDQLPGVEWAKLDLKKSRITLDFKPGVPVTEQDVQNVIKGAGYKPGPIRIELLPRSQVSETGPGWMKIKHPKSKNPVRRWFELNF